MQINTLGKKNEKELMILFLCNDTSWNLKRSMRYILLYIRVYPALSEEPRSCIKSDRSSVGCMSFFIKEKVCHSSVLVEANARFEVGISMFSIWIRLLSFPSNPNSCREKVPVFIKSKITPIDTCITMKLPFYFFRCGFSWDEKELAFASNSKNLRLL